MGVLDTLKGPELVINFQRFCGVIPNPCRPGVHHESHPPHKKLQNGTNGVVASNGTANGDYHHGPKNGFVTKRSVGASSDAHGSSPNGVDHEEIPATDYIITNKLLFYFFHFGANLGNEVFYILFYPFFMWNFDAYVGRRICMFWSFFMYLGQATKDVVRWPRPASPPVIRLEQRYALEYGMPSTHAMVGAGLPFSIFFYTVNRYQYPWYLGFTISITWCMLVSFSRIYLGMHTFLDVLAGLVYVFGLMPLFFSVVEAIDYFALTNPIGPLLSIIVPFTVCAFYPALDRWSTARGDTTLVVSVTTGVLVGYWWMTQYGIVLPHLLPESPYEIQPFTFNMLALAFARLFIGAIILVICRAVLKFIILNLWCRFLGVDKNDEKVRQELRVELPYKFTVYSLLSVVTVCFVPQFFVYFGIQRDSYFTEGHTYLAP